MAPGLPDIRSVPPDLAPPPMGEGEPGPGRRVRQVLPGSGGTHVYHALYLPTDWQPGRGYPVIVEYTGNGSYCNEFGDVCTGRVEDSKMGYGISGGQGSLWLCLPFVDAAQKRNAAVWWGDVEATVDYCQRAVRLLCEEYGGDREAVILAGFSRGAIACGHIGLHDDATAGLWLAFVAFSHYDGAIESWPYAGADRASALARLQRLGGRASFVCNEGARVWAAVEKHILASGVQAPFTFCGTGFRNHDDAWVLRVSPARRALRQWLQEVLETRPGRRPPGAQ